MVNGGAMTTHDILTVRSEVAATLITLRACGEVDLDTAAVLRDELLRRLKPGVRVHLNLEGVTFMDSSGLHVLLSSQRRADLLGSEFSVVESSPQVRRLLEISGLAASLMAPQSRIGAVDERRTAR